MKFNKIYCGDCIKILKKLPQGCINLVFADPPFNIGIKYDVHKDNMKYEEYISWMEKWIDQVLRILKKMAHFTLQSVMNTRQISEF